MRRALLSLALACLAGAAGAVECRDTEHAGNSYTICEVDPATEDLRLFLNDDEGAVLGGFDAVEAATGGRLAFAMNAGMYHEDRAPVGLFVEEGREVAGIVTRAGPGNFGLLPNGVFCIEEGRARVIETRAYAAAPPPCRFATQSGPMLVIDGALHPRFLPDSSSRYIRNGVGTSTDGDRVVFAISDRPVTFHRFARLFSEEFGLPNALYLDGGVSRLHAPALGRSDSGAAMGPIIAIMSK